MAMRNRVVGPLAGKSSTFFLIAGTLLVGFAALMGYQALIDTSVTFADNEADVVGPAGFVFGFLGLLGLYPSLADRSPKLAGAGAVFAGLGAAGFTVVAMRNVATLTGVGFPSMLKFMMIFAFVGFLGGYPVVGVTSLRTAVHSRALGLLLLAPVAVFAVMLSNVVHMVVADALANFVLASGQAVAHLAIGVMLRNGAAPLDSGNRAPDAAA